MENYYTASYPESGGSSPRSREIDFDNPQPWDQPDHSTANNSYKVKLMCSYGGKIHPRPHDNQLAYVGGDTKILAVDRSIKFSSLLAKLAAVSDVDVCFKYQLPGEDLDALISVTDDDDLDHMMNEYDRLNKASSKPARLRLFLFPVTVQTPSIASARSFGSTEGRSERERFVDALNSGPVQSSTPAAALPTVGNADFLFGSEKGVPPAVVTVPKVPDLAVADPPVGRHDPETAVLDDREIGADRIQKHIQDLRRLRIAEDQQQNIYMRQSDDAKFPAPETYAGDYYVQRTTEKVVSTTLPVTVSSPAPGYQISGGYRPPAISTDQQPVYMAPPPASRYHAPIARPVTGSVGQGQGQGYYAVQRMPTEVHREQPVYNTMQQVATQPPPKIVTHSDGIRMIDASYAQVAYDNGIGRHVYYTTQGSMVAPLQQPPPQLQQTLQQQPPPPQLQQTLQPQPVLQPMGHQYQAVAGGLSQDGKVIGQTKITQG